MVIFAIQHTAYKNKHAWNTYHVNEFCTVAAANCDSFAHKTRCMRHMCRMLSFMSGVRFYPAGHEPTSDEICECTDRFNTIDTLQVDRIGPMTAGEARTPYDTLKPDVEEEKKRKVGAKAKAVPKSKPATKAKAKK